MAKLTEKTFEALEYLQAKGGETAQYEQNDEIDGYCQKYGHAV